MSAYLRARRHLAALRKGALNGTAKKSGGILKGYWLYLMSELQWDAEKSNYSLEELGTSKAELEALRARCAKAAAKRYLSLLRKGAPGARWSYYSLRTEMELGGFSAEAIGTSEAELRGFRARYYIG